MRRTSSQHYGTLKMPEHDVERELTLLRQNWKDLPISAVVSEYGYACHAQRLADIGTGKTPCLVDCRTPRTMKRKTFRPEVDIKRRPKSAGARRPKTPSTARDARWEASDRVRDAGPVGRDQGDLEGRVYLGRQAEGGLRPVHGDARGL